MPTWEETKESVLRLMKKDAAGIYRYGKSKGLEDAFDELASCSQMTVIRECLASEDSDLRNVATWLLLNSDDPWPEWLTTQEKTFAMKGMAALGVSSIPITVLKRGLQAENKRYRTHCALLILESREDTLNPEIRTSLLSVLEETANNTNLEPRSLVKAIDALVLLGGGDFASRYIKLCVHAESQVRKAAIQALLSCPKTKNIEEIVVKALNDPDPTVQCVAIEGVRTFSLCEHLADICTFVEHDDSMIRNEVKRAFQEIATEEEHLRLLLSYLGSSHVDVSHWIMDLYGSRKCSFAVGPLKRIAAQATQEIRKELSSSAKEGIVVTGVGALVAGIISILVLVLIAVLSYIWSRVVGTSSHVHITLSNIAKYGLFGFVAGALLSAVIFIQASSPCCSNVRSKAKQTIRLIKRANANK